MAELNLFHVGVTFHPNAINNPLEDLFSFTLNGQPLPDKRIHVPSGIAMIVFNLTTAPDSEDEASFQTSPIQWFGTRTNGDMLPNPIPVPGMFTVERTADKVARLIDFNSNTSHLDHERIHWFNLVVAYMGKTYGADPSIVNEPPDGIPE